MFFYGFLIGAAVGMFNAKRRKGNFLDLLQWGAGFGFAFGLVAMVAGILWARTGF